MEVATVVALQEKVAMEDMDVSIVDSKATKRRLAPTFNKNLHCLREDHREVRVPQFLFRAIR